MQPRIPKKRQGFFAQSDSPYFFDRFIFWFRGIADRVKAKAFGPLAAFLHERLKLSPNHLTVINFLFACFGAATAVFVGSRLLVSVAVLGMLLADGLDGTIARKYNLGTERGKMIDVVTDIGGSLLLLIGVGIGTDQFVLALIAGLLFMAVEWIFIVLAMMGVLRTPSHGHIAANLAFFFTWYTLGLWFHIILNGLNVLIGIFFFIQHARSKPKQS